MELLLLMTQTQSIHCNVFKYIFSKHGSYQIIERLVMKCNPSHNPRFMLVLWDGVESNFIYRACANVLHY